MKIETNWHLETPDLELQQFVSKIKKEQNIGFSRFST
jgi:hypothetical protein